MNRLRTVVSVAALVLFALSGAACKQGLGERCELNSDCGDGLKCSGGDGTTMADSGNHCVSTSAPPPVDASVVDTGGGNDDVGTTIDTATDTATDQAMTTDASTGDAPVDTSASDTASGSDTGATPDASPDATDDASTSG
jgi:hypothetical protein